VKRPHAALKLAAVASSVVLVAGFVSYRAGAFEWLSKPDVQSTGDPGETILPSSKVSQIAQPKDVPAGQTGTDPAMMSGSKSIIFVVPPSSPQPGGSTAGSPPPIMGGSKSLAPVIPPASPPPSQATNPPK
jgi:hypothetical protein